MSYPSIIHMQSKLCFVQLARPVLMYVQKFFSYSEHMSYTSLGLFGCMLEIAWHHR